MSITSSILSILFISCLVHTLIKRRKDFNFKWDLLRLYLFIAIPSYLILCDIDYTLIIPMLVVMGTMTIRKLLITDKRFSLLLNLVNVIAIIVGVNALKSSGDVSQMTFVGLSYCFAAFFTSFFDSVLLFKENFKMRPLFLFVGYLLIFHIVWSVVEVGL